MALFPTEELLSVEALSEAICALADERQQLRARGANTQELERNRLDLVEAHRQIGRALFERHARAADKPAA